MTTTNVLLLLAGIGFASLSRVLNQDHATHSVYRYFNGIWPGLIGFVIATFTLITTQAKAHAEKFKMNETINHTTAWLLRVMFAIAITSIIHIFYWNWMKIGFMLLFAVAYCNIVFNISLYQYRNLKFDYQPFPGDPNSSFEDRIFQKFGHAGSTILDFTCLAIVIFASWKYVSA